MNIFSDECKNCVYFDKDYTGGCLITQLFEPCPFLKGE